MKHKVIILITILFSLFLGFIVFAAANKMDFFFFRMVHYIPYGDKVGHFCGVGAACFMVNLALQMKQLKSIFLGSLIMFFIVTIEEFSQIFLVHRNFDLVDLAFNYLGIIVFAYLASKVHLWMNPNKEYAIK